MIDPDSRAEQYGKAGDILAEMLGYAIATVEAGDTFTDEQLEGAREGIIIWHRMRASV